ncbi:pyridoxal phosphate-dependent transferase [Infundibulicybe gibba]|nr:pyridoxal phosphate-dependent transferase [Infundibulicybe gibba]
MPYYPSPEVPKSNHATVGAWFLGPQAENVGYLGTFLNQVIERHAKARKDLSESQGDPVFITQSMQTSKEFEQAMNRTKAELGCVMEMLANHSVPFWSPRYNAHMNMDTTMPAMIGYLATMLCNPNNVATEASPWTTLVEGFVGVDLCTMLGYNPRISWGHITCDGSVANLEAIWSARNLKFYPLSLKLAITTPPPDPSLGGKPLLGFLSDENTPFTIETCDGATKKFLDCTIWELMNLQPHIVLGIPNQLYETYGISQTFLQTSLSPYSIQTLGKGYIEQALGVQRSPVIMVGTTKHYSWPKGLHVMIKRTKICLYLAIAGIGSQNVRNVPVDNFARMDASELEKMLQRCLQEKQSIFQVVAIMGSTEHGAVDPLVEVLALRKKYQAKGLSFMVHCDAAWGGYFASMLEKGVFWRGAEGQSRIDADFVPSLSLKPYTRTQLESYKFADSITIDPHKSGYIPYPAGGLCYKDARTRYLVTWTSPIVFHQQAEGDKNESIGVYGVEGSKPGAAAVATWLSHRVIGLTPAGYGTLLGEATFSCTKLYCHWATMSTKNSDLVVVPFNMLPAEAQGKGSQVVEEQKEFIRKRILGSISNTDLYNDKEAWELVEELAGDLMINAFACNFRIGGKINDDVDEANFLNSRIFTKLAIQSTGDNVQERPLILTSTTLKQKEYGGCLTNFKERLGLKKDDKDLFVLVNVTMSPWSTTNDFLKTVANEFEKVANKEVEGSLYRNTATPDMHGFVMQGTDKLHLVHLPMFNMENHRHQTIITAELPEDVKRKYVHAKQENPSRFFTLGTINKELFTDIIQGALVRIAEGFQLTNIHIIKNQYLGARALDPSYPTHMPFYLYGTQEQMHIDHVLAKSTNIQLNSDRVKVEIAPGSLTDEMLAQGITVFFDEVRENILQPLAEVGMESNNKFESGSFHFAPGKTFKFTIPPTGGDFWIQGQTFSWPPPPGSTPAHGTITLGTSCFAESHELNMHPMPAHHTKALRPIEALPHFVPANTTIERKNANLMVKAAELLDEWERVEGDARRNNNIHDGFKKLPLASGQQPDRAKF